MFTQVRKPSAIIAGVFLSRDCPVERDNVRRSVPVSDGRLFTPKTDLHW